MLGLYFCLDSSLVDLTKSVSNRQKIKWSVKKTNNEKDFVDLKTFKKFGTVILPGLPPSSEENCSSTKKITNLKSLIRWSYYLQRKHLHEIQQDQGYPKNVLQIPKMNFDWIQLKLGIFQFKNWPARIAKPALIESPTAITTLIF
jgi:hypothetical protein